MLFAEAGGHKAQCSICFDEFSLGEKVWRLPVCEHIFHQKCVEQWFGTVMLHSKLASLNDLFYSTVHVLSVVLISLSSIKDHTSSQWRTRT